MKKINLIFCLLLAFSSCNKSAIYNKFDDGFEENRWQKTDVKTYAFSIDDESKLYDLTLRFGHVYDYQFDSVPINVSITNPTGQVEKLLINLKIKDENGKQLADCSGDVCDLNYKIKEKTKLTKGNYAVAISQSFNGAYLPNVLGVGLKVEEVK
jgi:gliding motility-associated lipoprotein GldH